MRRWSQWLHKDVRMGGVCPQPRQSLPANSSLAIFPDLGLVRKRRGTQPCRRARGAYTADSIFIGRHLLVQLAGEEPFWVQVFLGSAAEVV